MSDAWKIANCSFPSITYILDMFDLGRFMGIFHTLDKICTDDAACDLVHDLETVFRLC